MKKNKILTIGDDVYVILYKKFGTIINVLNNETTKDLMYEVKTADQEIYVVKRNNLKLKWKHGLLKRLQKYNLTYEKYKEILKAHNDSCAICGNKGNKKPLSIDHDHNCCTVGSCGYCIRGLLCTSCNRGLGFFHDDIKNLEKAIRYLTYSKEIQ